MHPVQTEWILLQEINFKQDQIQLFPTNELEQAISSVHTPAVCNGKLSFKNKLQQNPLTINKYKIVLLSKEILFWNPGCTHTQYIIIEKMYPKIIKKVP